MKQATFAILNTFLRLHEHACISVEFKWSPLLFDRNAIERLTFRLLRDLHITHTSGRNAWTQEEEELWQLWNPIHADHLLLKDAQDFCCTWKQDKQHSLMERITKVKWHISDTCFTNVYYNNFIIHWFSVNSRKYQSLNVTKNFCVSFFELWVFISLILL